MKSLQGEVTGATSGGDDETETDETPENQHSIGSMLPGYRARQTIQAIKSGSVQHTYIVY